MFEEDITPPTNKSLVPFMENYLDNRIQGWNYSEREERQ